ncbi:TatD family hydrolase [Candidatus Lokiarchaeum ossiferum]|uniref:TatD family hydrolase n=1 Tax=Candidatus Lokiarchaeum ossiferum TaxID=2951803 RepID=UPI00352C7B08
MFIDAHCHLIYKESSQNIPEHLAAINQLMQENNLDYIVSNTSTPDYFHLIEHEKKYPKILSAIAINRNLAKDRSKHQEYLKLLRTNVEKYNPEAIGEVGLDYYAEITPDYAPKAQQYILEQEILLAKEFDLPLVIHSLYSDADLLAILRKHHAEEMRVHIHGTQITQEFSQDFIDMGFYFSLSYYHHFDEPDMVFWIDKIPFDHLLFETDSPYAYSVKNKKGASNSADVISNYNLYCEKTGKKIDTVIEQVSNNFKRFYRL